MTCEAPHVALGHFSWQDTVAYPTRPPRFSLMTRTKAAIIDH